MIRLGSYAIAPDTNSWQLGKLATRKTKHGPKEYIQQPTYHPTLESAIRKYVRSALLDSDPNSLHEAVEASRQLAEDVARLCTLVQGAEDGVGGV